MSGIRRWWPLVVAAVLMPACSDDSGSSGSSGSTPADSTVVTVPAHVPAIDTGLVQLSQLLDDEGVLPIDIAQRLFAAVVAPLPGVEPLVFDGGVPHDLAGLATRRLVGAAASLPAEVNAAVQTALEPQPGEEEVEVPLGDGRRRDVPSGDGPVEEPSAAELAEIIATIVAQLEANSGHELGLPIRARLVRDRSTGGDAITSAIELGDRVTACRIALPHVLFTLDGASVTSTIAHEVWHCFQLDANAEAFWSGPLWVIEGQAEWAGEAYVGGSSSSASRWDTWLLTFNQSLFRRSYDAIGLYAVAAQDGSDPWPVMLGMLGRANFGAVEALFAGSIDDAVLSVASAVVRSAAFGDVWQSTGPGITSADGSVELVFAEGASQDASVDAGRFGVLPLDLLVPAGDIAKVTVSGGRGAVQLTDSALVQLGAGESMMWCLRPDRCVCPDGTYPGGGDELPSASPGVGAAAVGTLAMGELVVSGTMITMDDACNHDIVGTWLTDAGSMFAVLSAAYGGGGSSGGVTCAGPYSFTFTIDGLYHGDIEATCGAGPVTGVGRARYDGVYTAEGSTLRVTAVEGGGTITIGGQSIPMPGASPSNVLSLAEYTVVDDVLTITFVSPVNGSEYSFVLTRVS
ncbi:MAG: hypothetical protein Q7V57_13940 [Actinomycetota bacterium]|nr:hypothetical protein [Actinomycetota bacterium]